MRKAAKAWIVVWGGIAALDVWLIANGYESLSSSVGRGLQKDAKTRWMLIGGWSLLTAHLFAEELPIPDELRKYDPIGYVAKKIPVRTYEAITNQAHPISESILDSQAFSDGSGWTPTSP